MRYWNLKIKSAPNPGPRHPQAGVTCGFCPLWRWGSAPGPDEVLGRSDEEQEGLAFAKFHSSVLGIAGSGCLLLIINKSPQNVTTRDQDVASLPFLWVRNSDWAACLFLAVLRGRAGVTGAGSASKRLRHVVAVGREPGGDC